MTRSVLTKTDFVKRYAAGEFGNASPTWNNLQEWIKQNGRRFGHLFHVRNRIAGGKTWYNVPYYRLDEVWKVACNLYPSDLLYISAMAPTELTLIQGEVQEGLWGLDLYYTQVKKPMRDALKEWSRQVNGVTAQYLLQKYLCPNSYEWLSRLLETYPAHVVEFSSYSTEWGTIPGYNTVFWEVRLY